MKEASSMLSSTTTSADEDWDAVASKEATLELVVACEGLPADGDGRLPNPIVDVAVFKEECGRLEEEEEEEDDFDGNDGEEE